MATPLLYDLNQEQYSLGRNTGRFNAVRQTAAVQPGADALTSFLSSLKVPVKPQVTAPAAPVLPETLPTQPTAPVFGAKPVAPTIKLPTVTPIDPGVLSRTQGFKGYEAARGAELREYMNGPASGNSSKSFYDWHTDMLNRAYGGDQVSGWDQAKRNQAALNATGVSSSLVSKQPSFWNPILQMQNTYGAEKAAVQSFKPQFDAYNSQIAAYQSATAAAKPQIDAYNAAGAAYNADAASKIAEYNQQGAEYNKQMEPIKAEVDRYNTELSKYKTIADQFNAEVAGYFGAREGAVNQFMADRQNMEVTGQQQQSRGQQLANTSTYADDLHQQMLDRIGEVNLEAQQQHQSSIYSS